MLPTHFIWILLPLLGFANPKRVACPHLLVTGASIPRVNGHFIYDVKNEKIWPEGDVGYYHENGGSFISTSEDFPQKCWVIRNDTLTRPTQIGFSIDYVILWTSNEPWLENWSAASSTDTALNITCSFNPTHHRRDSLETLLDENPFTLESEYNIHDFSDDECPVGPSNVRGPLDWSYQTAGFNVFKLDPNSQSLIDGFGARIFSSSCTEFPGTLHRMFQAFEVFNCQEETKEVKFDSSIELELLYTHDIETQSGSNLAAEISAFGISGGLSSFKDTLTSRRQSSKLSSVLMDDGQSYVSTKECSLWKTRLDPLMRPLFDAAFLNAGKRLSHCIGVATKTRNWNLSMFCVKEFIDRYGLYYVEEAILGSRSTTLFSSKRKLEKESDINSRENCLQEASERCMGISFGKASVAASVESCIKNHAKDCEEETLSPSLQMGEEHSKTAHFTIGGLIRNDFFSQNFTPLPIHIKIRPIADLFQSRFWSKSYKYGLSGSVNITGIRDFINYATAQYCKYILQKSQKECQTGNPCIHKSPCLMDQYCVVHSKSSKGTLCFDKSDDSILFHLTLAPAYDYYGETFSLTRLRSIFEAENRREKIRKYVSLKRKVLKKKNGEQSGNIQRVPWNQSDYLKMWAPGQMQLG